MAMLKSSIRRMSGSLQPPVPFSCLDPKTGRQRSRQMWFYTQSESVQPTFHAFMMAPIFMQHHAPLCGTLAIEQIILGEENRFSNCYNTVADFYWLANALFHMAIFHWKMKRLQH
ncbi:hypothetical protein O6H91_17G008600 [Diphasiastrum complanatum]|uniref:Uncharacterized protein n=2 Tax=Diphasiastrum complanatum TaxID=34168 RepID=A0ACC2B3Z4_DIPCM|nr:hypothetical protein O6H91_17G008200 [Diphasiastrum complanatum]KAJ7524502.1 hypothetical protein O6H91_17G008600 [Diphasiastrum complanatum]